MEEAEMAFSFFLLPIETDLAAAVQMKEKFSCTRLLFYVIDGISFGKYAYL